MLPFRLPEDSLYTENFFSAISIKNTLFYHRHRHRHHHHNRGQTFTCQVRMSIMLHLKISLSNTDLPGVSSRQVVAKQTFPLVFHYRHQKQKGIRYYKALLPKEREQ